MKIENNSINPLNPKKTDPTQRADRKPLNGSAPVDGRRDKAEVSDSARLLAKARIAMERAGEAESEQVVQLRKQIQNGDYSVQVEDIVRRLMSGVFSKK